MLSLIFVPFVFGVAGTLCLAMGFTLKKGSIASRVFYFLGALFFVATLAAVCFTIQIFSF